MQKIILQVCPHSQLGSHPKDVKIDSKVRDLNFQAVDYYFDGQLLDPESTISQIGLKDGDFVQTYQKNKPMYKLDISFQMPDKNILQIKVDHVWTFRKVSRMLQDITGIDHKRMRFYFAGRQLNMSKAFMNDSCLMTGSTIRVLA